MNKEWKTYLERVSYILKVVRKRNAIQRKTEEKMRQYSIKQVKYTVFFQTMQEFATGEDKLIQDGIFLLSSIMQDRLKSLKKQENVVLTKYKEGVKLTWEIEREKQNLLSTSYWNSLPKLRKEEVPKDKLYELVFLILLACEENALLSEEDFLESKEAFFTLLQESKDPILQDLVFQNSILYTMLDAFLEKLPSSQEKLVSFTKKQEEKMGAEEIKYGKKV